ncbi:hypothetical protein ABFS82_14G109400 [Erythranthe guttata]
MAISSKNDSNRDPHSSSSSSKSKLKQKNTWEFKKQLVEKRLIDLDNMHKKNSDSVRMDKTIVCSESKEKSTTDLSSSTMQRAEEIQKNLPEQFPSFVKLMSRSHVTQGFWLGVPRQFCDDYLPMKDVTIVLIGENEKEFDTRYLAAKNGLSGGWKFFAAGHKLIEGDAVVFQLIEPCKFKAIFLSIRNLITHTVLFFLISDLICFDNEIQIRSSHLKFIFLDSLWWISISFRVLGFGFRFGNPSIQNVRQLFVVLFRKGIHCER